MQTRSYKDLFRLITSMICTGGELPGSGTEDTQVADFINRRFQQAFDTSPVWPRYFVNSEARDIISLIISGLGAGSSSDRSGIVNGNYILLGQDDGANGAVAGSNVYYNPAAGTPSDTAINSTIIYKASSGNRWQIDESMDVAIAADGSTSVNVATGDTLLFEADTNKKDNPSEVVTWTLTAAKVSGTPLIVDEQLIPYAQTGKTTIGDFNRIHRKRAFLNNSAIEYEFFVDLNGANILNIISTTDNEAFVSYKKQFTPFTVTSDFYNQGAVEVPGEFFNFIAHAVYADFLRVQNRQQEAIAEEQVAQTYLNLELEKIDIRNNNNTVNKRFSTYVNRQSR